MVSMTFMVLWVWKALKTLKGHDCQNTFGGGSKTLISTSMDLHGMFLKNSLRSQTWLPVIEWHRTRMLWVKQRARLWTDGKDNETAFKLGFIHLLGEQTSTRIDMVKACTMPGCDRGRCGCRYGWVMHGPMKFNHAVVMVTGDKQEGWKDETIIEALASSKKFDL